MVSFFVDGLAETKGSWRAVGAGRMIPDNPRAKSWESRVSWSARLAMRHNEPMSGACEVVATFVLPVPPSKAKKHRRDLDKLARAALDGLNGIVYVDDEQVAELHVRKVTTDNAREIGMHIAVSREPSGLYFTLRG